MNRGYIENQNAFANNYDSQNDGNEHIHTNENRMDTNTDLHQNSGLKENDMGEQNVKFFKIYFLEKLSYHEIR